MCEDIHELLTEAKERLETSRELRQECVQAEDDLKQQAYRLRRLEADLDAVRSEIQRLECPNVLSFLSSFLSNKEGQLDRAREVQTEIAQECGEAHEAVVSLEERISELRHGIDDLRDAEAEYSRVFDLAERAILDRRDAWSEQLDASLQTLEFAKTEVRKTELAIEAGEIVAQRLSSMSGAFDRARKKRIYVSGARAIGNFWNNLQRQCTTGFVSRVRRGLEQLHQRLAELDLNDDAPPDREISRLAETVRAFSQELTSGWTVAGVRTYGAGNPIEDVVQSLSSHLEEKLSDERRNVHEIEDEKRRLVERYSPCD